MEKKSTTEKAGCLHWLDNLINMSNWLVLFSLADLICVWPLLFTKPRLQFGDTYEGIGKQDWLNLKFLIIKKKSGRELAQSIPNKTADTANDNKGQGF